MASDAIAAEAARRGYAALTAALARRGRADICLTGGSLGIAMLTPLAEQLRGQDLSQVHIWWGDERHLPAGHEDRNSTQAMRALADLNAQFHPILPAPTSVEAAAAAYARKLQGITFDCVFLGMGPDGHIASLFPEHTTVVTEGIAVVEYDSPKPPPIRVSLTLGALRRTRDTVLLFAGEEKSAAAAALSAGADVEPDGTQDTYRVAATWTAEQILALPARGVLGNSTVILTDHRPVC